VQELSAVPVVFVEIDRVKQARDHDEDEHDPHEDKVRSRDLDDAVLKRAGRHTGRQPAHVHRIHGAAREHVVDAENAPQDGEQREDDEAPHIRSPASRYPCLPQPELVLESVIDAQELERPRPHADEGHVDAIEGADPQPGDSRRDVQSGSARNVQKNKRSADRDQDDGKGQPAVQVAVPQQPRVLNGLRPHPSPQPDVIASARKPPLTTKAKVAPLLRTSIRSSAYRTASLRLAAPETIVTEQQQSRC
jgi:hypothetical protein